MNELSIKIVVGGRSYPITVKPEEEEGVRKASELIEGRLKDFERNYGVRDKQDLLAMCALQLANEIIQNRGKKADGEAVEDQLASIENLLDVYLKKV